MLAPVAWMVNSEPSRHFPRRSAFIDSLNQAIAYVIRASDRLTAWSRSARPSRPTASSLPTAANRA